MVGSSIALELARAGVSAVPGALNIETSRPTWQPCQLKSIEVAAGTVLPLASATPLAICDMSLVTLGLVQGDTVVEVAFADGARLDTTALTAMKDPADFAMATQGKGAYTLTVLSQQGLLSDLPFLGYHNPVENNVYRHRGDPQHAHMTSVSVSVESGPTSGFISRR